MITEKDCPFCDPEQMLDKVKLHNGSAFIIEPLNPVVPGHLLIIPKTHITPVYAAPFMGDCLELLDVFLNDIRGRGHDYNLIVNAGEAASQSIEHTHIHYVPRQAGDGLQLPWTNQHATKNDIRCKHCGEVIVEVETTYHQGQHYDHGQLKTVWIHAYSGRTGCANFPEATP